MTTQQIFSDIVVPLAIALIGTLSAIVKNKLSTHSSKIEELEKQLETLIGEKQYQDDVTILKQIIKNIGANSTNLTLAITDEIINQALPKLSTSDKDVLTLTINKIVQGIK